MVYQSSKPQKQVVASRPSRPVLTEAQKAAKAQKAEQRKREREIENEKCKKDLQCWGSKSSFRAISASKKRIENHAKYDFKWTDGWLEPKFSRLKWKNKKKLIITYVGDKIQFQNGFGAYQNHIYEVDFDTLNEKLLGIRVYPGRLN